MSQYTVEIRIQDKILKTLSDDKYSLCIQKYLGSDGGDPVANLVPAARAPGAHAEVFVPEYSTSTTFSWVDQYSIAATDQQYKEGGYFTKTATSIVPISTTSNDSFVVNTWSDFYVKSNSGVAPANGFAFQPGEQIKDPGASSVVYLNVLNVDADVFTQAPFYMSPEPSIGGATDTLIPIEKVVVFFYRNAQSGTMISTSRAYPVIIDLTQNTNRTYQFLDSKTWKEVVSNN
ncbi:hypothetical protein H0H92_003815 [Tricholoma furcatifolium]|nr:hypothetical protein H0H92_003815 [Tricholoma furcatifolium]